MAKVVVLGVTGEATLWAVDLEAGSVSPIEGALEGEIAVAAELRKSGVTVTKGVDLSIAVGSATDIAKSHHEN